MHARTFFDDASAICGAIDVGKIEQLAHELAALRERGGRLFLIGVGGSAGNCSHAVNDFRKLCGIEAYAPDRQRLRADRAHQRRGLGNGVRRLARSQPARRQGRASSSFRSAAATSSATSASTSIRAIEVAKTRGAKVFGIVGATAATRAQNGDVVVVVPAGRAAIG